MNELSDRDQRILDFERLQWTHGGSKEASVRDLFDLSPTKYWQRLDWIMDQPEAMAYDGQLVNRLHRLRAARRKVRSARERGVQVG